MTNFGNLITAAITPFDKNGIISTDTFFRLCRKLVHDKSESIGLTGTTGESPNLTQDDREIIYKTAKDSVGDKVKLIAGTGTYSTKESIENSRIAEDLGMDGIMIVTPYYSKPSQLGILKHFEAINNKSNLPIMAYNIPGRTSTLIELETIETLVNDINIHSIKDAVGDIKFSIEQIERIGDKAKIYSGDDASIGDGKVTGEGGNAFKVECKHGRIVLIAKSSDIELRGRNISLVATKNIHLNAKINTTIETGNDMNIWAKNDMNLDSNVELFINGGKSVGIHCEADVIHTTSGRDEDDAPDFYNEFSSFYDPTVPQVTSKIDRFNGTDDLRG